MLNNKPSVFLVAENHLLRETLARLLNKQGEFNLCGISFCDPNITSSVVTSGTDILILDPSAVRLSDSAFVSALVRQIPRIKVVVIDMDCDPEAFLESVRAASKSLETVPAQPIDATPSNQLT
jgi:DNA-binding NarL/FixJ family response regulator